MSTEKLPEWPENPGRAGITVLDYWAGTAHAALARMEALVEYAQGKHKRACALRADLWADNCTCGLSALLAACKRGKEAGR